MRCSHAADASLAPTETPRHCAAAVTPSAECPGPSKISAPPRPNRCSWLVSPNGSLCGACQLGACANAWVASLSGERRRSRAMPMLSMKTKKPMKPMLEIVEITDDAGLSSPNQPASAPTSKPSHPIHRGSARVVRMATAYSGTTTPKPRKLLPAALVTRAMAAKVSAVAANVACPAGSAAM